MRDRDIGYAVSMVKTESYKKRVAIRSTQLNFGIITDLI